MIKEKESEKMLIHLYLFCSFCLLPISSPCDHNFSYRQKVFETIFKGYSKVTAPEKQMQGPLHINIAMKLFGIKEFVSHTFFHRHSYRISIFSERLKLKTRW